MHVFMFVLGWLTLTAALLCLAWQTWCVGRWLYRNVYLMHPTYGEADRYARKYLIKPCKLWEETPPLMWEGRLAGVRFHETPLVKIGRPHTTARATKASSWAVQEAARMSVPILPFSRSAPLTTPTIPAGQHSPFAVRQDVLPDGEKTPVSDA